MLGVSRNLLRISWFLTGFLTHFLFLFIFGSSLIIPFFQISILPQIDPLFLYLFLFLFAFYLTAFILMITSIFNTGIIFEIVFLFKKFFFSNNNVIFSIDYLYSYICSGSFLFKITPFIFIFNYCIYVLNTFISLVCCHKNI